MQLVNEFTVSAAPESAFATLSDLERLAPCMPGAVLDEVRGDEYVGRVRVGIGPVGLSFAGVATVLERDVLARRLVVRGAARDQRGQGGAEALITVTVADGVRTGSPAPSSTVRVVTDLGLSGKVGQFGGAAINQVSGRLVNQFVERLDELVRGDGAAVSAPTAGVVAAAPRPAFARAVLAASRHEAAGVVATVVAGVLLGVALGRSVRTARAHRA